MDGRERGAVELRAERLQRWQELEGQVNELADKLGLEIDPGIRQTVVALHAHGLETSQSCEGHDDHGEALPWVEVATEAPGGWEGDEALKQGWRTENERLAARLAELLEQWYAKRVDDGETIDPNSRLELHPQGIFGAVRLEPGAQARVTAMPAAARSSAAPPYRGEMERFTSFLRERFLGGF